MIIVNYDIHNYDTRIKNKLYTHKTKNGGLENKNDEGKKHMLIAVANSLGCLCNDTNICLLRCMTILIPLFNMFITAL